MNKELVAKIIDGKVKFFPRKKKGTSKSQYLANLSAANRLNGETEKFKLPTIRSEEKQLKLFIFDR